LRVQAFACLVAVAASLCACETDIRFAPRVAEWTAGDDRGTWRSGDVEVSADLVGSEARFPIRGEVRCPANSEIAFVPEVSSEGGEIGELRMPDGRTLDIAPKVLYLAPQGGLAVVGFSLRPDVTWSGTPVTGSTISYTIVVRDGAAETRCPFWFRVEVTGPRLTTLGAIGVGAATAALIVAIVVGATAYFVITSF
jgi:hypothetical protein